MYRFPIYLQMMNDYSEPAGSNNWLILPLHSRISGEEQSKVFQVPPSTCRKIILATNIAESSITVPDIVYVVDFCLIRQLVVDENTNFSALKVKKKNIVRDLGYFVFILYFFFTF
jgi:HrpA-like RNA helicase